MVISGGGGTTSSGGKSGTGSGDWVGTYGEVGTGPLGE